MLVLGNLLHRFFQQAVSQAFSHNLQDFFLGFVANYNNVFGKKSYDFLPNI
jgi:hypothetical protein